MTRYRNTTQLPRERRGEPATGDTCHHGRALAGEGCPACGAEAGENVDLARVAPVGWVLPRRIDHPDLTGEQHATLGRLIRRYGLPFAFSMVAGAALPTWQNIGTVSVRIDGAAYRVHDGAQVDRPGGCKVPGCAFPGAAPSGFCAGHDERYRDLVSEHTRDIGRGTRGES